LAFGRDPPLPLSDLSIFIPRPLMKCSTIHTPVRLSRFFFFFLLAGLLIGRNFDEHSRPLVSLTHVHNVMNLLFVQKQPCYCAQYDNTARENHDNPRFSLFLALPLFLSNCLHHIALCCLLSAVCSLLIYSLLCFYALCSLLL
jgi:hypothetical protein